MKKILMITHYCSVFWGKGNNRFNYLADVLAENGYSIEFITSDFSHGKKEHMDVNPDEYEYGIKLIHEPGYPKNVCLKRFYSHNRFGWNLRKYLSGIEKPDLVYAAVPSLDAALAAEWYCAQNGIPFIVDIQDLWPEAFRLVVKVPVLNRIAFLPYTLTADRIYKGADKIIGVSETFIERGTRVSMKDRQGLSVFLGTDLARFDQAAAQPGVIKPENEIWIAYIGTLGHNYDLKLMIDALQELHQRGYENLVFKIFGDGPLSERFMKYAGDKNIRADFMGRLPYAEMVKYFVRSDIAVNPIMKGAKISVLNKHSDYAAAGIPVVNTQECPEYRRLIEEYGCGINCGTENKSEVADAIAYLVQNPGRAKQMGAASRHMAEECFDRRNTYPKIVNSIEQLLM